jgi:hypothetical protein
MGCTGLCSLFFCFPFAVQVGNVGMNPRSGLAYQFGVGDFEDITKPHGAGFAGDEGHVVGVIRLEGLRGDVA